MFRFRPQSLSNIRQIFYWHVSTFNRIHWLRLSRDRFIQLQSLEHSSPEFKTKWSWVTHPFAPCLLYVHRLVWPWIRTESCAYLPYIFPSTLGCLLFTYCHRVEIFISFLFVREAWYRIIVLNLLTTSGNWCFIAISAFWQLLTKQSEDGTLMEHLII